MSQPATTTNVPLRTLVLDDDLFAARMMQTMLKSFVRDIQVDMRRTPDPKGDYDVYFIDNDFDGVPMAATLAEQIRQKHPHALVIAFSGTLDSSSLKGLIRAGCDGVCDKSHANDLPVAIQLVEKYGQTLAANRQKGDAGVKSAILSVYGMLKQWNHRLESEGAR